MECSEIIETVHIKGVVTSIFEDVGSYMDNEIGMEVVQSKNTKDANYVDSSTLNLKASNEDSEEDMVTEKIEVHMQNKCQ